MDHQHTLIKKTVQAILENPHSHHWTVQGLGMLRTYLDKETRLHVWCDHLRTPNVSMYHTHPWHFHSYVVAGQVEDREMVRTPVSAQALMEQRLRCGAGGCLLGEPVLTSVMSMPDAVYRAGETYHHLKDDIHASFPADGTVTLCTRQFDGNEEEASVFWPRGQDWVTAEPRRASGIEVMRATRIALHRGFKPNVNLAHLERFA